MIGLIVFMVIVCIAAIAFEVWIIGKGGKYTGLVLPVISFAFSFLPFYLFMSGSMADIGGFIVVLLVLNIPTAILLLVYFTASKDRKNGAGHGKADDGIMNMRIRDL